MCIYYTAMIIAFNRVLFLKNFIRAKKITKNKDLRYNSDK